ncbi:Vacuolar protein sorting-associated protein 17 [Lunasporangiospora selenospora]|uniref:Vacuolar protein sorting-associated protein 17 n=1 Tax=Lunasporangiospora selenospora TaxID=979761 RepID=A0A9P6KE83_9FUNG|nr:Vacuolar protein sorting-associated protein 17 [Lunasporangiospora selenospora]
MAQGFTDPLTSAAYASSKIESRDDPLLMPSPSPATRAQHLDHDSRPPTPLSTGDQPAHSAPNRRSPLPVKKTIGVVGRSPTPSSGSLPATRPSNPSPQVSSFSSPSSPKSNAFLDPLQNSGDSSSNVDEQFNSRDSGYATGANSGRNAKTSNTSRSIISTTPPVHAIPTTPTKIRHQSGVNTTQSSSSPPSPPPNFIKRETSYDQQRAKAPQYLGISIHDRSRVSKDGMFVLSVQTNMPRYKKQSYHNVARSYLEFVRLREHFVAEHPEVIVPPLPPERSLVSASDIDSIQLFLDRICRHPVLSQDYELQMFIESEFGFLPAKPKKMLEKFLNISVKRFSTGPPTTFSLKDTDDEFEEERAAALKVETRLQIAIKSLDREIKSRRDLSSRESEFTTLCSSLAAEESSTELIRTYKLLAKSLEGIAKASKAQIGGDATVLGGYLDYKLQHAQALSGALNSRLSVLSEYDVAVKSTKSKRKTMERLRSSTNISPDKVTDSIDDLEDATLFEGNMKKRMEQVNAALAKDLEEYRQQSQEDMLRALRQYSQRQIGFERAKLEELLSVGAGLFEEQHRAQSEVEESRSLSGRSSSAVPPSSRPYWSSGPLQ